MPSLPAATLRSRSREDANHTGWMRFIGPRTTKLSRQPGSISRKEHGTSQLLGQVSFLAHKTFTPSFFMLIEPFLAIPPVIAPVTSNLLFTLTDALGTTITSSEAISVRSNGRGMAPDVWCQFPDVPAPHTNGSNRLAWNASNAGNHDNEPYSLPSSSVSSHTPGYIKTTTQSIDPAATDLNDRSTTTCVLWVVLRPGRFAERLC